MVSFRLLRYSLDPGKIRSQDSVAVINSIAHNPEGRIMAWEFVQQNYDLLFKRYGNLKPNRRGNTSQASWKLIKNAFLGREWHQPSTV